MSHADDPRRRSGSTAATGAAYGVYAASAEAVAAGADPADPQGLDEDDQLDDRRREVHGDRDRRLLAEDERRERPLDDEERRQGDAAEEGALAAAGDGDGHEEVRDGEDEGGPADSLVLVEQRLVDVAVVQDAVHDEEDGREQHEEDDRTDGTRHQLSPSTAVARVAAGARPPRAAHGGVPP